MRIAARIVFLAAAWLAFFALPAAAAPTFPQLTGRVVDDAGILSEDTRGQLTSILQQQEQQTGDQIVVVTLKSLQGYPIEDYGYQLGRAWGIGQKGKDNGALIIIAPSEHQMRIEVGYGLEGQLTDAQSKLIIAEIMTPYFKRGDYDGGVLAGTTAVLKTIGGAAIDPNAYAPPDEGAQAGAHGNPIGIGIIPILLLVILFWIGGWRFLAALFLLNTFGRGGGYRGGWGGGGFGGGGFGGGGFSGGGGGFGGGGASGSW